MNSKLIMKNMFKEIEKLHSKINEIYLEMEGIEHTDLLTKKHLEISEIEKKIEHITNKLEKMNTEIIKEMIDLERKIKKVLGGEWKLDGFGDFKFYYENTLKIVEESICFDDGYKEFWYSSKDFYLQTKTAETTFDTFLKAIKLLKGEK